MTITTTNYTTPIVAEAFLAIERINGGLYPSQWNTDLKEASRVAFEGVYNDSRRMTNTDGWSRWHHWLSANGDLGLGLEWFGHLSTTGEDWMPNDGTKRDVGAAIRDVVAKLVAEDARPTSGTGTLPEFPDPEVFGYPPEYGSARMMDNMRWWVRNGVSDVADGVDEQSRVLRNYETLDPQNQRPETSYLIWPAHGSTGEWATSARGKDFLSALMQHKRYLLAEAAVADSPESELMLLRGERDELAASLEAARQAHREDLARVSRRLKVEARSRGWCSEYEQVVEDLNNELHVSVLDTARLWDVYWNEQYTLNVQRHLIVEANDEDEARSMADDAERSSDGALAHHIMSNETPPLQTDVNDRNYTVNRYSGGDSGNDGEWSVWDQHDSDNYEVEISATTSPSNDY